MALKLELLLILVTCGINWVKSYDCTFNSMCLCWVQDEEFIKTDINCMGIPFARFPDVSVSYVGQLDVAASGLQVLSNDALEGSSEIDLLGLVSNRLLTIGDKPLVRVRDSLRQLDLSYNALEVTPLKALSVLNKLTWLNMHSNHLTSLDGDWGQVSKTLRHGFFGENSIIEIPKVFSQFESLVWLNLENNNVEDIDVDSLSPNLHTLSLNNNLLKVFPSAVSSLKDLTWLYLRGNSIKRLVLPEFSSTKLEVIDLSENFIESISYHGSNFVNRTLQVKEFNLGSNKLSSVPAGIFEHLETRRIHLPSNGIRIVDEQAFHGLENSLEYLNLENNELQTVPMAISRMKKISYLYLANNDISNISASSFNQFAESLKALSLATNHLDAVPVDALSKCQRLLHLNLGYNKIHSVDSGDFAWAEDLEILLLRNNFLTKLRADTFKGSTKLKELSLSFNHLSELDDHAFRGIEETLEILELSFAFSTDVFPERALRPLTNLLWLVMDNNNFQSVEATTFYSFQQLHYINLESNRLHYLPDRVFLADIHAELRDIKLGYNFLAAIPEETFHNLTELKSLDLTGNRIRIIGVNSIVDCPSVVTLSLAYNRISKLEKFALRGLTNLRFLHLEFNRLLNLDLDAVVESGAPNFALNASFNAITTIESGAYLENLTILDLGFNNFTKLVATTFDGTPNLRTLDLRNNYISVIEPGTFTLRHLESLNLRNNKLENMRKQAFYGLEMLQQLDISGNELTQLSPEQFKNLRKLRVVNLSRNKFRSLPRDVFAGTLLEILDLSRNKLTVVPSSAFQEVAYTLRDLNLAENFIDHLDSTTFPSLQLVNLNLAKNHLTNLPDNSFVSLGKLLTLNISHNSIRANFKELFHFLPGLKQLYLANCGLSRVPLLPLDNLHILDLSHNNIEEIVEEDLLPLAGLKVLHLVNNYLSSLPPGKLTNLRALDISGNLIEDLPKDSFANYPRLESLNIKNLNRTRSVDKDCLHGLRYLKDLRIQTWPHINGLHLRNLLNGLPLRTVEIKVTEHQLKDQIQNVFTKQLRELTITGDGLEVISPEAFSTIEGGELVLRIKDTRVRRLQSDIFLSLTKRLSQLTLDLRNNHINELSPSVIYGNLSWESVGTNMVAGGLQVSGNPLECDCEIAWLSLWLRRWLRESRQIHTASQSDARQLRNIAGRAVCTENTPSYSSDKVLLTLGTPHTACQASALSSGNYERTAGTWIASLQLLTIILVVN